ncbi:YjbF family lipoprotein [Luteimonas panaciterrae]|uniref:YjbF family lipoprotein n=1 Tax=Luteimonas panaciterrae TaxID=363885 RepID=UPI001CFB7712|nr:YjbF family lipoprotein [Luteimonas panaciterrae]
MKHGAARLLVHLAWLFIVVTLAGCTTLSLSNLDSLKQAVRHRPTLTPTAAEVAARPYYQLLASTPEGDALLVLGNIDGGREAWYGANGVIVFIEHGRIVKTAGLKQNLDNTMSSADDPFVAGLHRLTTPTQYVRVEDWTPGYRFGVQVQAHLASTGQDTIEILGAAHQVMRVEERVEAAAAGFSARNRYWVDPRDGFIWKSEQTVAPGQSITLVQLRPYRPVRQ